MTKIKIGDKGRISGFTDERLASKMISMGIRPGVQIEFVRSAPFGGGWYIKTESVALALRKREVQSILFTD